MHIQSLNHFFVCMLRLEGQFTDKYFFSVWCLFSDRFVRGMFRLLLLFWSCAFVIDLFFGNLVAETVYAKIFFSVGFLSSVKFPLVFVVFFLSQSWYCNFAYYFFTRGA